MAADVPGLAPRVRSSLLGPSTERNGDTRRGEAPEDPRLPEWGTPNGRQKGAGRRRRFRLGRKLFPCFTSESHSLSRSHAAEGQRYFAPSKEECCGDRKKIQSIQFTLECEAKYRTS